MGTLAGNMPAVPATLTEEQLKEMEDFYRNNDVSKLMDQIKKSEK